MVSEIPRVSVFGHCPIRLLSPTYLNATDINIYKQMEQIFTNTEQNIDIIKDYPELYK